jgi:putative CocE/NonD family hydrolase
MTRHPRATVPAIPLGLSVVLLAAAAQAEGLLTEETVRIPMRDAVELAATLVRPPGDGPHETILVRTPYGRQQHLKEARFWAENGYAVVVQDTRGKWESDGEYMPFLDEHFDGVDTLEWIVAKSWSSGRVGMWGSSYLAFCQFVLASSGASVLKSILPISGWLHDEGQIICGGANHIMLSIPWILHEETQTRRSLADYEIDDLFEHLPLIDAFQSIGLDSKIWNREFDFTPLRTHSAADIAIPALHMTGWNDFVCEAALRVHEQAGTGRASAGQKLVVGPWAHDQFWTTYTEVGDEDFGPESAMGRERLMELSLEWFDRTLGPDPPDLEDWPAARVFVMGANEWRNFDTWPPAKARNRALHLGSSKGANSSAGDGTLSTEPPAVSGTDVYSFDPMNPVPTYGGANMHFMMHLVGVKDQRDIEERDDVLVYTTPPLAEPWEIIGPVRAVLYASTEGRDTDFTAKLVEVRRDGYARIIEEGIIRVSYRNGIEKRELLEPGRVYRLTVELGVTAIEIPRGSRIRLEVSSSNFPKYDRNPNTGEDALEARTLLPVTQTVHHGGSHRSHVLLPVLEREVQ